MEYLLSDILNITGGIPTFHSPENFVVQQLLTDSRSKQTVNPENTVFFAIKGERNNGHLYIQELFNRGIKNFVVSEKPPELKANFILVEHTVIALQLLAAHHRNRFNYPVFGITGSNGKTIVKEWLHQLISTEKNIVRSPKSYNSQLGVPLSVWQMKESDELALFEAGISRIGEMPALEKIIRPTHGIITNIGAAHDGGFENRKQKTEEKLKLFRNSNVLFYCSNYSEIEAGAKSTLDEKKTRFISWSKNITGEKNIGLQKKESLIITGIKKSVKETLIEGTFNGVPPEGNEIHPNDLSGPEKIEGHPSGQISITIPFTDDASIENAIHCWLVLLFLGYQNQEINKRMQGLIPIAMRLEQKEGIHNCTIINDSYNSDTGSLAIALDFLNQQNQHPKKTLILSDIFQSGKEDNQLYSQVAGMVNNKGINRIIGIGKSISLHFNQFDIPEKKFFYNTDSFLKEFSGFSFENEAILLKGARPFGFERINSLLQKKSHETVLEIHLNALVHNLNFFKSKLNPATKIMAMVKAFSYGSGSHEIANILQFHKVDYLAVAYSDEGVELRNAGITLPIMVMNPEAESFESLLKFRLEPEIYSFRLLQLISDFLNKMPSEEKVAIHLKIDTGMQRLGFSLDSIEELIEKLNKEKNIIIKSVFSHLAASDEPRHDDFTRGQIKQFDLAAKKISDSFSTKENPIMSHILNSTGVIRFPQAKMDMVRLGIGLYGIASEEETQKELQNVAVLKTTISQIKKVKTGQSIGYDRKAFTTRDSVTATIPIGYADGLSRRLGNGTGKMIIISNGEPCFAPVIGNVCMDMCMLDITGINAREGDEVIVFGKDYTIEEMANDAGTIPYEILTGISRRVKRIYFQE